MSLSEYALGSYMSLLRSCFVIDFGDYKYFAPTELKRASHLSASSRIVRMPKTAARTRSFEVVAMLGRN